MAFDGNNDALIDQGAGADIDDLNFNAMMMDAIHNSVTTDAVTPEATQFILQWLPQLGLLSDGFKSCTDLFLQGWGEMSDDAFNGGRDNKMVGQLASPKTSSNVLPFPPR